MKLKSKMQSLDDFKMTVRSRFEEEYINYDDMPDSVKASVSKINHGTDFFSCDKHFTESPFDDIMGFRLSSNDSPYLGCTIGGKNDYPFYFIVYLDAKGKMGAYIPRRGNVFDYRNRTAWKVWSDEDVIERDRQVDTDAVLADINSQFGG